MIGKMLSHYQITEKLGEGGMGEVYRAEDTNLSRQVAIKVLPDEFAHDAERLARFEREAKLLASLNHPNIAAIHGLEEHEGKRFLVLELVEGQTLAERLKKGRIPLDETLDICRQIAEGLEAAHEKGIIHRDLKPANVKVTPEGKVKILDFGLAKAFQGEPTAPDVSKSPTLTSQMTHAGVILGTAAYMSPEQARGKAVDKRADIWAFGCTLYECLTGQRAFPGETITEAIAKILESEPDWTLLPADTPPSVRTVLRRCLQKDPSLRLRDIADARMEIEEIIAGARSGATAATAPNLPPARRRMTWREELTWALVALTAIAGTWMIWSGSFRISGSPPNTTVRATIPIDSVQIDPLGGQRTYMAISPDGRLLVFRKDSLLYLRPIDSFKASPIEGTYDAAWPVFSPDGAALAFVSGLTGGLKRVSISGGPVKDVATVVVGAGITWGEDNRIYFSAGVGNSGIWSTPAAGGEPRPVTRVDDTAGENAHTWPQLLPGGKILLFTALGPSGGSEDSKVATQSLESGERRTLVDRAIFGRYLPSGHLIYANNSGTVFARPFDRARMRFTGEAAAVLQDVGTSTWGGAAFLSTSADGTLIYLSRSVRPGNNFRILDSNGHDTGNRSWFDAATIAKMGPGAGFVRVSPGGQLFAFDGRAPGTSDIWILDQRIGEPERLTLDPAEDEFPVWSPDGRKVAYTSAQTGSARRILIKSIGGGTQPTLVKIWPRHCHVWSWSPDGDWLTIVDVPPTNPADICLVPVNGKDPIPVANSAAAELSPQFSPDGKWIAYASDESGRYEVYVISFPGLQSKYQLSTDGGTEPQWDPQGRVLYYLQNGYLVAHDVGMRGEFTRGRPRKLFKTTAYYFQVLPGGRFLLQEINTQPPDSPIQLVVNWFPELLSKFGR